MVTKKKKNLENVPCGSQNNQTETIWKRSVLLTLLIS